MPKEASGKPIYYANDADRKRAKYDQTIECKKRKRQAMEENIVTKMR